MILMILSRVNNRPKWGSKLVWGVHCVKRARGFQGITSQMLHIFFSKFEPDVLYDYEPSGSPSRIGLPRSNESGNEGAVPDDHT